MLSVNRVTKSLESVWVWLWVGGVKGMTQLLLVACGTASSTSILCSLTMVLPSTGEMKMDDDSSADQQFQVFKDFDFLDIELDEMEVSYQVTLWRLNIIYT